MTKFIQNSIKNKLMFGFLFLVALTGASSIFAGYRIINRGIIEQAYESVRSDLITAQYIYNNRLSQVEMTLNYLGTLDYMGKAVANKERAFLKWKFLNLKNWIGADIIIITDNKGRVIQRVNNNVRGDSALDIQCIKKVVETSKLSSGSSILTRDILLKESRSIADKALIDIIPTEMGRHITKEREDRALVLNAATPMFSDGKFVGVIYGAFIVNNNFEIVDKIKNLVFPSASVTDYFTGKATIFIDDIRISTNVVRSDGKRSTGTQVSAKVYESVFDRGEDWVDRAFVVSRWFLAAYTPIYDTNNSIIGILYVGVPQERFDKIKDNTIKYFLFISLITAMCGILIAFYLTNRIVKPINEVVAASDIIAGGNYSKKLRVFSDNELSHLSEAFNRMIDAIYDRDLKIKETAHNQIAQSEKLASLGRLAAGIAHEINNPLTGVLTYSSMLKDDLAGTEYVDDLNVIIDETLRCRKIVKEVLDFARETRLEKEYADINKVLNGALAILEKHVNLRKVKLTKIFADNIPEILVDVNQMKQVINNLALNAADAMPDGGELTIETSFAAEDNTVRISFRDTGAGISAENLGKIFDPFFTTKEPGKGTGLGLAVIYGIIERHNGRITVHSDQGNGTEFLIKLPVG
ncbi:MAG TPA: cache domain-containing protein [Spirochaetota bacterium]|nr:cache domain-containing protein [Spirochaetota bacterium]HPS86491.1 cache domain-containing protein [Spirochaetota bacterium]